MYTEFEATYLEVDKEDIRAKLKKIGAELKKPEFLQKRKVFELPSGHEIQGGWLRVRDESDKITMSLKIVRNNGKIDEQKEINLKIDNFDNAVEFLKMIGCVEKAYQETKRELWIFDKAEITIDTWPYLEPYVEIEAGNEEEVKRISELLSFDYSTAYIGSADGIYAKKYNVSEDVVNSSPILTFEAPNPFV